MTCAGASANFCSVEPYIREAGRRLPATRSGGGGPPPPWQWRASALDVAVGDARINLAGSSDLLFFVHEQLFPLSEPA